MVAAIATPAQAASNSTSCLCIAGGGPGGGPHISDGDAHI